MGGELESSISALCGDLSAVLDHADSSSRALADVVSQPPIHLDSATNTFLRKLDLMTEAAGADLARLESMAFGAVSFAELLGHCGEALKVYDRHADAIEARLVSFGYVPPEAKPELDAEEDEGGLLGNSCFRGSSSVLKSGRGLLEDDDALFEESVSLKNLGLSDACLAALSSEATDFSGSPRKLYEKPESTDDGQKMINEAELVSPQKETNGQVNALEGLIMVSKEEYEQLPPYMRTLASWEELQEAISKLNSYFGGDKTQGIVALNQDDVGTIGLGRKGRSYLLILLRLNRLAMETVDGSILYTLRKDDS
ncbi:hypothetical protein EJB05_00224 [Eragrostis curvula]|uniref:Uncharacterized protein n=1 Tax=Eragrostis curvula TaxID=38414 RepID=A0A5J9WL08_9POAL|nr:hypothetical protein EJB05_00224 [Eragrostis curvula]